MRISMFNCVVSQSLSAINSAAVSIKIISTDLWVFLNTVDTNPWGHALDSRKNVGFQDIFSRDDFDFLEMSG